MRVLMRLGHHADAARRWLGATAELRAARAPVDDGLRHRVERRFEVLPVRGGVVLTPKRRRRREIDRDSRRRDRAQRRSGHRLRAAREARRRRRAGAAGVVSLGRRAGALGCSRRSRRRLRARRSRRPPHPKRRRFPRRRVRRRRPTSRPASAARTAIAARRASTSAAALPSPKMKRSATPSWPSAAASPSSATWTTTWSRLAASVHLGPKAVVRGDVTSIGGHIEREPGLGGRRRDQRGPDRTAGLHAARAAVHGVRAAAGTPCTAGCALFGTVIAPRHRAAARDSRGAARRASRRAHRRPRGARSRG